MARAQLIDEINQFHQNSNINEIYAWHIISEITDEPESLISKNTNQLFEIIF